MSFNKAKDIMEISNSADSAGMDFWHNLGARAILDSFAYSENGELIYALDRLQLVVSDAQYQLQEHKDRNLRKIEKIQESLRNHDAEHNDVGEEIRSTLFSLWQAAYSIGDSGVNIIEEMSPLIVRGILEGSPAAFLKGTYHQLETLSESSQWLDKDNHTMGGKKTFSLHMNGAAQKIAAME